MVPRHEMFQTGKSLKTETRLLIAKGEESDQ
jgi:hypothetical protein